MTPPKQERLAYLEAHSPLSSSRVPFLSVYNGPSSLLHALTVLRSLGVSYQQVRLIPTLGRVLEPEIRPTLEGLEADTRSAYAFHTPTLGNYRAPEPEPLRYAVNVRDDNRLHRFVPLLVLGLPPTEAVHAWSAGLPAPETPLPEGKQPPALTPLEGFTGFYWSEGYRALYPHLAYHASLQETAAQRHASPWWMSNRVTPAERLAIQLCLRFYALQDEVAAPDPIAPEMLLFQESRRYRQPDPGAGRPLASVFHDLQAVCSRLEELTSSAGGQSAVAGQLISPWAVLAQELLDRTQSTRELVEVFMTQALLTVASADGLGGFELVQEMELASDWFGGFEFAREMELTGGGPFSRTIHKTSGPAAIANWFNAYPHLALHRETGSHFYGFAAQPDADPTQSQESEESGRSPEPPLWSAEDARIQRIAQRIATWYQPRPSEPTTSQGLIAEAKVKAAHEQVSTEEMLALGRAYLSDFLPDYPRQVGVTGGMNLEGILLGLIARWLEKGAVLGMTYKDWELFSLEDQVLLCGLLVQRRLQTDPCTLFREAVYRLVLSEAKVWLETFRPEKVPLGSPLAQLGRCLPLGGRAALHAPVVMVRIPRDHTRDPDAPRIQRQIKILERLFLPAHIPARLVWREDWAILGQTIYLHPALSPLDADLRPEKTRLYEE